MSKKFKCVNCPWEGDKLSKKPLIDKCPVCGDEVKPIGKFSKKEEVKESVDEKGEDKAPVAPEEPVVIDWTKSKLKELKVEEQDGMLKELGVEEKDIPERESDKIKLLLKLYKDKK